MKICAAFLQAGTDNRLCFKVHHSQILITNSSFARVKNTYISYLLRAPLRNTWSIHNLANQPYTTCLPTVHLLYSKQSTLCVCVKTSCKKQLTTHRPLSQKPLNCRSLKIKSEVGMLTGCIDMPP
jgi:hypothetical protein